MFVFNLIYFFLYFLYESVWIIGAILKVFQFQQFIFEAFNAFLLIYYILNHMAISQLFKIALIFLFGIWILYDHRPYLGDFPIILNIINNILCIIFCMPINIGSWLTRLVHSIPRFWHWGSWYVYWWGYHLGSQPTQFSRAQNVRIA